MASDGFRCASSGVSRGKDEWAGVWQDFGEKWVIWDADADGIVVVVVKMMEIGIFG